MSSTQQDFYHSFVNWSASIGCPKPDHEVFRTLARGNGARLLRLLVEYVRPLDTVSYVQNTLRLHSVPDHDQPVFDQSTSINRDNEKLAFLRRSHVSAINEIDHLNQKQLQLERSIRKLSNSVVLLEHACQKNSQNHVQPIRDLTECIITITKQQENSSERKHILLMGDSGRFEADDPVRSTLHELYGSLANNHSKIITTRLPFPPTDDLVDAVIKISRERLALLQQNDSQPEGSEPVMSEKPMSFRQLMQDSRNAHNDRFFNALDKLNLARDAKNRCEGPSAPEQVLRQIRLRARLDCLNGHIKRCEQDLSRAQADYNHLQDSLDAISKLDVEREKLHQELVTIIRANRELRSVLTQTQVQCRLNQASIDSTIKTVVGQVARLNNCFEIETRALLPHSESEKSLDPDLENVQWQTVARNLGLNSFQFRDPISILINVRSWFERSSSLQLSITVESPLLSAAKQIDSGDVEGLTARCKELHAHSERTMLDFNSIPKTLENLGQESDNYQELLKHWWEQPAQYTVPDEQRLGLNITSWIDRRRKLKRDVARRMALV